MYIIHESANTSLPNTLHKNEDYIEFIAILQTANKKNRNGRYYPRAVLDAAIKAPYVQERLATKSLWSELNHPSDPSVQRQTQIDMNNIGVVITQLYWEGDNLMGRCETLPTQKGRDIMNLIKSGCRIAFSMRGQGKIHHDHQLDATVVEPGLSIITFDVVVSPSHAEAYLQDLCEASFNAFTSGSRNKDRRMALTEAINLAENGALINLDEEVIPEEFDYAASYGKHHKNINEMYQYDESDKVLNISENKKIMTLASKDGTYKKVIAEDYIIKDIRKRIINL